MEDCLTMRTRVSTKGQVVIPSNVRDKLEIRPGDTLETRIEEGSIVLTPTRKRSCKARIIRDPITGLPVLTLGKNAPKLTSKRMAELLVDFL
jgi:AbrB family looped-hinge helix DNA binding protein